MEDHCISCGAVIPEGKLMCQNCEQPENLQRKINPYCVGCIYYGGQSESVMTCNYIFREDRKRPCPPGKDCTVRRSRRNRKRGGRSLKNKDWYNAEGYPDPTAYYGITNAMKGQKGKRKRITETIRTLKGVAKLAGFEIVGRITLRDVRTGKEHE